MEQWSLHQGPGALAHVGHHLPPPPHLPWSASCLSLSPSLTPSTLGPIQPSPFPCPPQASDWVMSAEHAYWRLLLLWPSAPGEGGECMQAQAGFEAGATLPCAIFRESMQAPSPLQAGRVTVCALESLAQPNPGTRHGGGVLG